MDKYLIATRIELGARISQQDAIYYKQKENEVFGIVCDGMGGLDQGEIASNLVVNTLAHAYEKKESTQNISDFYVDMIDILDEKVYCLHNEDQEKAHAGTTLCSIAIKDNQLNWLSIGDSRCYIIRGDEIVPVTRDHNFKLILDQKRNLLSLEEYEKQKKYQDALISYIGIGGIELFDCNKKPFILEKDDYVLVTSDGLYKVLDDEIILSIIKKATSLEKACDELCKQTKEIANDKQDNTSFILLKIE